MKFLNIPYAMGLRPFFIFEHSITSCWVCFAGKMPASNILYNLLWVQEDERRARIVNPVGKKWMQQGLNPWLQGERPAPKPLNPSYGCQHRQLMDSTVT